MQMQEVISKWIESVWYENTPAVYLLAPLSWLYRIVITLRRVCYRAGVIKSQRSDRPVIVVGNITVGGTGKTPLVIWIVEWLKQQGYRPGVVSRGYGATAAHWPQIVESDSDPSMVGDEPLLIFQRTACPVVVDPIRIRAARILVARGDCDIIVSDDGLQHYALERDIEVVVVDGERRFGNGRCLPAGPLREPVQRLPQVDLIVCNGTGRVKELSMQLVGDVAVNLDDQSQRPLANFFRGPLHALVGIGNPQRFLDHLARFDLQFDSRVFPDHHHYRPDDIVFQDDAPVLMTEKDAVKCRAFADKRHWYVPVTARLDDRFGDRLLNLLQDRKNGQEVA
jgi:tetraacyldisaccharide 4'-kinase